VEAVVQEIPNETIDIVPWVPDAAEYVCRALAPGKVAKIIMDEDYRAMEVIVPDDQLLLAIGDRGENIRLASQLTGWRLEVLSESEAEEEAQRVRASISAIPGIDGPAVEALVKHGFRSCAEVAAADSSALEEVDGLELSSIDGLLAAARSHVAQLHGLALEEE
jgi:N utilization substance protein A